MLKLKLIFISFIIVLGTSGCSGGIKAGDTGQNDEPNGPVSSDDVNGDPSYSLSNSTVEANFNIITSGSPIIVTVTVMDENDQPVDIGDLNVACLLNGDGTSTGVVGEIVYEGDGVYTAPLVGVIAGTPATLVCSVNEQSITTTPLITVAPGDTSLSNSDVAVVSGTVSSGSSTTITLTVRDCNGNIVDDSNLDIAFEYEGGTSTGTVGNIVDNEDGIYSASFTCETAGTAVTIYASIDGENLTSVLPTITVTPGGTSLSNSTVAVVSGTVSSGSSTTITLTVKDGNGNIVDDDSLNIEFWYEGGTSTGTIGTVGYDGNGIYSATFEGDGAGTATTILASIDEDTLTSTFPTVTVTIVVAIGDSYQGGIVAYILQAGDPGYDAGVQHGLIVATGDQSIGASWITGGDTQTTLNDNTSTDIGTGQANTTAIMEQPGHIGGAAQVCDDYINGAYEDWYLPSKDELNEFWNNKVEIGGFADQFYWSSSEFDALSAWSQGFYGGSQGSLNKANGYSVRCVRAF